MILLTTDQARVVHAVLEFGPQILQAESDREHLEAARARLADHVQMLVVSMVSVLATATPEPPMGGAA